jgi:TatD DNase family protein
MIIDLHCHFDKLENLENVIKNAREKRVGIIVSNGTNVESNREVLKLSKEFDEIRCALGMYPIDCLSMDYEEIDKELDFIKNNKDKIIAIGEVGLDFKEDLKENDKQIRVFKKIVELANEIDKPLIIHSRKAEKEVIDILEELKARKVVMHCFSGKLKMVERILTNNWYLTIPTSVKNSEHFQKVIEMSPIEQLFCETDSPYLHPDKMFPNEPANVVESYKMISKIKNLDIKEVENKIEENFIKLFS